MRVLAAAIVFTFAFSIQAQTTVALKEQRIAREATSMFTPIDNREPDGLRALRSKGTFSFSLAPVAAESWDQKHKGLGLAVEVIDLAVAPGAVVIIVDGKSTVMPQASWEKDLWGNLRTVFEREDIVRAMASAREVSITVYGPTPVSASFHAVDTDYFRSVVSRFDAGVIESMSPPEAAEHARLIQSAAAEDVASTTRPVVAASTTATEHPKKVNQKEGIEGRVDEAASMCHDQIIESAKDPNSVEFLGDYSYGIGKLIWKGFIFVSWETMGRNTYGAVLRHHMSCNVYCPKNKTCSVTQLDDSPS